jgi:magnesium and cobalt transporter
MSSTSNGQPGTGGWLRRLAHSLGGEPRDLEQLSDVLSDARERGLIDADVLEMLEAVLQVSETQVRDVMVPRSQMVVIERDEAPDKILPVVIESGHSRFPVVGEDRDEVIGILLAKDLLRYFVEESQATFDIRECLRPAVFIPESKRLNVLLKEFRVNHNHMAIVVDEYGGVSGLLTIEDVLEEIVGEIGDEYDIDEAEGIRREADRSWTVPALTRIEDFNQELGTRFSDEEYDTIGGLVLHELGRMPRRGEAVRIGGLELKVTRADRRRIETLRVTQLRDGDGRPAAAEGG